MRHDAGGLLSEALSIRLRMTDPVNPYAPPSAELSAPPIEVPEGSLWRVVDGRLLVRNGATLPRVCIFGTQESGSNPVIAKELVSEPRWGWVFNFCFCLPVFWVIIVYRDLPLSWFIGGLAATFLPTILGKKSRITVWTSEALVRRLSTSRSWSTTVFMFGLGTSGITQRYFDRNGVGGFPILVAVALVASDLFPWLYTRRIPRLFRAEDGWCELKNIPSHVLVRLGELQKEKR